MQNLKKLRYGVVASAVLGAALCSLPARATNKDMVELQTQVQQLLDMVAKLQSTVDSRFGVIQHLVEVTADDSNRMTATVNALQAKIQAQADATNGKLDTASGQVQSLNDSVDELKTRIAKLNKTLEDLQAQLQNIQNQQPAGGAPAGAAITPGGAPGPAANAAPPLQETFQAGMRDYNAAKYDVATGEFQDVLHYYPQDDQAGDAQFYLGEIAYHQANYSEAVKDYSAVLDEFPGSHKAAAAQLRKGLALLQLNKRDAGIHELRTLIQRRPQTPEAGQARNKLNAMGVKIVAAR
jgi:TolA-binding protein